MFLSLNYGLFLLLCNTGDGLDSGLHVCKTAIPFALISPMGRYCGPDILTIASIIMIPGGLTQARRRQE